MSAKNNTVPIVKWFAVFVCIGVMACNQYPTRDFGSAEVIFGDERVVALLQLYSVRDGLLQGIQSSRPDCYHFIAIQGCESFPADVGMELYKSCNGQDMAIERAVRVELEMESVEQVCDMAPPSDDAGLRFCGLAVCEGDVCRFDGELMCDNIKRGWNELGY